jgi:hypothetical protein
LSLATRFLSIREVGELLAVLGVWTVCAAIAEASRQSTRQMTGRNQHFDLRTPFRQLRSVIPWIFSACLALTLGTSQWTHLGLSAGVVLSLTLLIHFYSLNIIGACEGKAAYARVSQAGAASQVVFGGISVPLIRIFGVNGFLVAATGSSILWAIISYRIIRPANNGPVGNAPELTMNLQVLVSTTAGFSLDTLVVAKILGPLAAATYAVTQRILSCFAVFPIALAPVASRLHSSPNGESLSKALQRVQMVVAGILAILLAFFLQPLASWLTHGRCVPNWWLVAAGIAWGLSTAVTSTEIQRASVGATLRVRRNLTAITVAINLILTIGLTRWAGYAGPLLATAASVIVMFLSLRKHRMRSGMGAHL